MNGDRDAGKRIPPNTWATEDLGSTQDSHDIWPEFILRLDFV
jgi:hypothetical protein